MCGIFTIFGNANDYSRATLLNCSNTIRHRGPDWSGNWINEVCGMFHERLSINGLNNGHQPIVSNSEKFILCVNGEIYNYKELKNNECSSYNFNTDSDCEVIIPLYIKYGGSCVEKLDGIFCFTLYDVENNTLFIARDRIGINSLYYGFDEYKNLFVGSEAKTMPMVENIKEFPPGNYFICNLNELYKPSIDLISNYYDIMDYNKFNDCLDEPKQLVSVHDSLVSSVRKRLMCEVPFGVLLSGGLDSSLIASITTKLIRENPELSSFGHKLHTFSIGLEGAPDLKYAKIVADHIGSIHHEFQFTINDGLDAIENIIYHLETYDVTTIRASIPMYLLSRKIKAMGIKMVLSGEGADELLGGYLYFHQAPNDIEFHSECVSRVRDLHYFDCLRANKSTMAWGLEVRVPFLDKDFIDVSLPIHPQLKKKNKIEKYILRKAFDRNDYHYLPESILWRQKEQFSDGVGYSWIDSIKQHAVSSISDELYEEIKTMCPDVTNREEAYYRKVFNKKFPVKNEFVRRWVPKMSWDGVSYDPSGRAQKIHIDANQ